MNVLCSDKTGMLTEGAINVYRIIDVAGTVSPQNGLLAKINGQLQQGFHNPVSQQTTAKLAKCATSLASSTVNCAVS
jgi:magnesium-transporting ATPase (P-type)